MMFSNRLKHLFFSSAAFLLTFPVAVFASENPITITFLGVSVKERAERAVNFLLGIAASIALLVIVISGVMMIASNGNPDARDKAKKALLGALGGLILVVFSYIFVYLADELLVG